MINAWLDAIANTIFIVGITGICLIAIAALAVNLIRDDQ